MKELIKKIEYNSGKFPTHELEEIIKRKDEAIPYLIDIIKNVIENPTKYIELPNYFGHIYAVFLLAQFKVNEFYPLVIKLLKLPDEIPYDLFGDSITDDMQRILASICGRDIEPIKELIENPSVEVFIRGTALSALVILVLDERLERKYILEYCKDLLTNNVENNNPIFMGEVVSSCYDLYPEEIYDTIKEAYEKKLIDESMINLFDINNRLKKSKEEVIESSKNNIHLQLINDSIKDMKWWDCFDENKKKRNQNIENFFNNNIKTKTYIQKIGRNEPCPCGSGKKYKKCCGK